MAVGGLPHGHWVKQDRGGATDQDSAAVHHADNLVDKHAVTCSRLPLAASLCAPPPPGARRGTSPPNMVSHGQVSHPGRLPLLMPSHPDTSLLPWLAAVTAPAPVLPELGTLVLPRQRRASHGPPAAGLS